MQPVVFRFDMFCLNGVYQGLAVFFFFFSEEKREVGIRSGGGTRFFFELKQRNGDVWDEESNEMKELKGRCPGYLLNRSSNFKYVFLESTLNYCFCCWCLYLHIPHPRTIRLEK